jgi:hypothetical protein
MAHFAEINSDNTVMRVIVVSNNELLDGAGNESEAKGVEFCQNHFGGTWLQTSYNGTFRKNYAGAGFTYDGTRNAFIAPKPFASWILNETSCVWEAPAPCPTDGKIYFWNEEQLAWVEVTS